MANRPGSNKASRRQSMIDAIKANGPMTISALCKQLGWSHETIRSELALNDGVIFARVDEQARKEILGSSPAKFFLTAQALGVSEEEYESLSDRLFRDDGAWFPKADPLLVQSINAMVRVRTARG